MLIILPKAQKNLSTSNGILNPLKNTLHIPHVTSLCILYITSYQNNWSSFANCVKLHLTAIMIMVHNGDNNKNNHNNNNDNNIMK